MTDTSHRLVLPGDVVPLCVDGAVTDRLLDLTNHHPAPAPVIEQRPGRYIGYFENDAAGVQIAERSLPEPFNGVLPWGWIDNRPFLRCLHGLAVSAWRLGEHDRAETLCWALLWLSPEDNQGVSGLLPEIIAGARWHS